jgi:TolA-binding protein
MLKNTHTSQSACGGGSGCAACDRGARARARRVKGDHRTADAGAATAGHGAAASVHHGHTLRRDSASDRTDRGQRQSDDRAANALQQKIAAQNDASNSKLDAVSGQVQSLNDSVDELKSRMAKLDKSIQDLQTQLQNVQNPPSGQAPAQNGAAPAGNAGAQSANQTPPLKETFQAGVRDLNAARYDVATGEFQDVIHYYPLDDLAGTSQYYLGEIAYRQLKFTEAVKSYNAVLEGFPGNSKAPAAQLRKGLALLQMNRKDAGIHELRLLIQRHPQTPEAAQARSKLNALGARVNASASGKPSPSTPRVPAPHDDAISRKGLTEICSPANAGLFLRRPRRR